ncbi:Blue-light-activated protein [Luteitalea pratensis]|uniref:histidine kinase n=1 Tax=Luteitalea pratensis TaxID=1855912 RepID=A0A143PRJ0_LUTPR|nr:response regulator [Luteitalea pratensis]AMY11337.1 Blue-light-activated protein [Luteitalea pratensis]
MSRDTSSPLVRRQSIPSATAPVTDAPDAALQQGLFGDTASTARVRRGPPRAIRLLLVEDSHDDAWMVQRQLERGGFAPDILRVQDASGVRGALQGGRWDLVIVDYALPGLSGIDAIRIVRQHCTNLPCLLVSGTVGEQVAVEAMRLGANDYLLKGNLTRLVPAVERELRESESRSERRRAEGALAASEERTRLIIEHALDAVVSFTAQGQITEWNLRAEELFGRSRVEVIGRPFHEVVLAVPARREFLDALSVGFAPACALGARRRAEVVGEHRDGRDLSLELSLVPVPSSAGLSYSAFMRDLSERRDGEAKRASLEAQLRQSQKMEAIGKLAGGVAHDFNNLLTVIQGQSALLEDQMLAADEVGPAARAIGEAADKAAELTRQLLAFSRRQVVQLTPTDVNELVADLGKLLRRLIGADIELHTVLAPGRVHINADAGMIEQVLMNLAVNARDAMPTGGSLVVSTAIVHARPPRTATAAPGPGQYARLTVRDSGLGIEADHLPHIFEPFYTTKDKARSTGLGLATVFGIVEQHRGWVEVRTKVGEGTQFDVYMPQCLSKVAAATPAMPAAPTLPRGHECVMVVEDELPVREMVRDVLVRQGYRVYEAASGREALDLWSRHQRDIDLLLTDIVMPDGIMGTDLVQRLTATRADLPVIFTSGYSQESDRLPTLIGGVNFLQKPYRPAALIRLIRERLDARAR